MPLFTRENAREYAAKGNAVRWSIQNRLKNTEPPEPIPENPSPPIRELADPFLNERVLCVREQLKRVDRMLMEEDDPQRIDRLASASARLSEVERQLAGRPLPGSLRPSRKQQGQQPASLEPLD